MSTACDGHTGLAGEVRQLAASAVDRLQPWLDRLGETGDTADDPAAERVPSSCAICPVCAVIAALRGERPELARRLAEHASGLLTVLRMALDEGDPVAAAAGSPGAASPAGAERSDDPSDVSAGRTVQRIRVHRPDPEPT